MSLLLRAGACLALLLATGCSTPQSRIKNNPAMFDQLPVEIREKVSAGEVDIGFSHDAVFLALGKPHRKYTRTTGEGQLEVWSWVGTDYRYERQLVNGSFRYRDSKGRMRTATDSVWIDVKHEVEYERMRVEFENDAVSAIERTRR